MLSHSPTAHAKRRSLASAYALAASSRAQYHARCTPALARRTQPHSTPNSPSTAASHQHSRLESSA
eukprot:4509912-Prymnesium_polylepis.1